MPLTFFLKSDLVKKYWILNPASNQLIAEPVWRSSSGSTLDK